MNRSACDTIEGRLREVERRMRLIRLELSADDLYGLATDADAVRHDAFWAGQELSAVVDEVRRSEDLEASSRAMG